MATKVLFPDYVTRTSSQQKYNNSKSEPFSRYRIYWEVDFSGNLMGFLYETRQARDKERLIDQFTIAKKELQALLAMVEKYDLAKAA